jgi:hemerythrin
MVGFLFSIFHEYKVQNMTQITKIQVTTGVYWVEIPAVEVYILCGCPADSVKHLMKRGLIVPTEKSGVPCETGPNVILLSDIPLQNGQFSNLAEFPVLQMLYRQGIMLPGHPNNTGIKPLLAGAQDQVDAQMAYIYRGNYGLVSHEELMATGISPENADLMMRMKTRFAFGRIRPTNDLLDHCVIGNTMVELRHGVSVRRLAMNVFSIEYGGESVTVDLNLPPQAIYPSPYPLGFHQIRRSHFSVIHSGAGDGWDVDRPTMSSVLLYQGMVYLVDAGPNLANILTALGIGINEIEGIFHTHAHDDHFAGIPTLMRAGHRIKYFAPPLVRHSVWKKLAALLSVDEATLDNYFDIVDLEMDQWNDIHGMEVKPVFSPHPVETCLYLFRTVWQDGYRSYGHWADLTSTDVLRRMTHPTAEGRDDALPESWVEHILSDYLLPANLKNLDIGGGMIHGQAEDFRQDQSDEIILSHTARLLTPEEKQIGVGAPFGTSHVLVEDQSDGQRRQAFEFLNSYFPHASRDRLRNLLNNPILTFNPESFLARAGSVEPVIYLVLSGTVEMIHCETFSSGTRRATISTLSAGALIGEYARLRNAPLAETYRAANFVRALALPGFMYRDFVEHSNLYLDIERNQENRSFISRTWLFGEAIAYPIHNRIAQSMQLMWYVDPYEIVRTFDPEMLYLIRQGRLRQLRRDGVRTDLVAGDFFGQESIITGKPADFTIQVIEPGVVYAIPKAVLQEIPIVQWKLFESCRRPVA